jgi:hypothetical protein
MKSACAQCAKDVVVPVLADYIRSACGSDACEVGVDSADKDCQTLLLRYESAIATRPSPYVMPGVKIELGARSENEPVEYADVRTLIDEILPGRTWARAARVRALDPRRTFLEKAFLIHEEIRRPPMKNARQHLSRHLYDLSRLIHAGIGERVLKDMELFARVLKNRRTLFAYSWIDYVGLTVTSLDLCPRDDQLKPWLTDYDDLCREMIYGTPSDFATMIAGIRAFQKRFMSQGD